MKERLKSITKRLHRDRLTATAEHLLRDEAISGKLILAAVAVALLVANTPLFPFYDAFLHTDLRLGFNGWEIAFDIKHWIGEGLMVFFFLVVGLELKRELVRGELRDRRKAILPVAAAVGGMVLPALIFLAINMGRETSDGWAIPTATDIALAVGILTLAGKHIPSSVRIFLLALAIVDDILAVMVIALFFNSGLEPLILAAMFVIGLQAYLLGKRGLLPMWGFVFVGIVMWLLAIQSGVHPSIIGVVLGFMAPMASHRNPGEQIAERAERAMIPFSTLFVVPIFAFANTGLNFNSGPINLETAVPLGGGIIAGLVLGKALGVLGMTWLLVKTGIADLPHRARWSHIAGVGVLAGIGFTVAIFVTDLAFTNEEYILISKLGIFIASAFTAVLGLAILRFAKH